MEDKALNLGNLDQDELATRIETVLGAISDFLEISLEYDFGVSNYERHDGSVHEFVDLKLFGHHDPLLIGYHGKSLDRIQNLMELGLSQAYQSRIKVILDIADYRQGRVRSLEGLARKTMAEVEETGAEVELEPMPAQERRAIHAALAEEPAVRTESRGEGRDRRIVVMPA